MVALKAFDGAFVNSRRQFAARIDMIIGVDIGAGSLCLTQPLQLFAVP
jgi:hypothetical protein